MENNRAIVTSLYENKAFQRVSAKTENSLLSQMEEGGYIKLLFCLDKEKPVVRTFTLSEVKKDEFSFEMVKHENLGHASDWRRSVKEGDVFSFKGPGPKSKFNKNSPLIFMAGDRTALPAMIAHSKTINPQKQAHLYFDVEETKELSQDLKAYFPTLENLETYDSLESFKTQLKEHADKSFLWVAGERALAHDLRNLSKEINLFDKYISSYWQKGVSDEQHRSNKVKAK